MVMAKKVIINLTKDPKTAMINLMLETKIVTMINLMLELKIE